jgi:hypothetical protein
MVMRFLAAMHSDRLDDRLSPAPLTRGMSPFTRGKPMKWNVDGDRSWGFQAATKARVATYQLPIASWKDQKYTVGILVNFDGDPIGRPIKNNHLELAVDMNWDVTKVEDRAALAKVKVGDKVDITSTEAMLVSIE